MHLCVQIKYIKAMNLNASKKTSELLPGTISELQGRTEPSKPGVYFIYFHTLAQSKTTMCKKKLSERKKPGISSELLKDTGMKIQTVFFFVNHSHWNVMAATPAQTVLSCASESCSKKSDPRVEWGKNRN